MSTSNTPGPQENFVKNYRNYSVADQVREAFDSGEIDIFIPELYRPAPALEELARHRQWVCWKYVARGEGKPTKVPVDPKTGRNASTTDPTTWSTYDVAAKRAESSKRAKDGKIAGVGFVLSEDDDYTGIDLDKCIDAAGNFKPWVADLLDAAGTYAEISPSGTGIRMFVRGKVDKSRKCDSEGIEIYRSERYLTITDDPILLTPGEINDDPDTLATLLARIDAAQPKDATEPARELQTREGARRHALPPSSRDDGAGERAWAKAALQGKAKELAATGEGGRNHALNASAYGMGRMVARGWIEQSEVIAALTDACKQNGLYKEDGPKGVRATLMSGLRSGLQSPHEDLPEREEDRAVSDMAEAIGRKIEEADDGTIYDEETGEIVEPPNRDHLLVKAWIRREFPPRDYLMGNVLCTTSRWLLIGETGVGKTLFCLDLAAAIAAGVDFVGWEGKRRARVMYLDGEMPAETFKERKEIIAQRYGEDIELYGYNRDDLGDNAMPPLNTPAGQRWLWQEIDIVKPDIIFFDNIMCLNTGDMKDDMSWEPVKPLVRKITSRRIAQIWMHHTGHDTSKGFGTKTKEWEMDTVAMLMKNDKGEDADMTSINLQFDKARLRTPATSEQFMPKMMTCGESGWTAETTGAIVKVRKDTYDAAILKNEIMKSYDALAAEANMDDETFDPQIKISVDAIREDLARRGILERNEQFGPITATARTRFHRSKLSLIQTRKFVEDNGMMWRVEFSNYK